MLHIVPKMSNMLCKFNPLTFILKFLLALYISLHSVKWGEDCKKDSAVFLLFSFFR